MRLKDDECEEGCEKWIDIIGSIFNGCKINYGNNRTAYIIRCIDVSCVKIDVYDEWLLDDKGSATPVTEKCV